MSLATPPIAWSRPPRRILVRGVNWLGDAVMTTPALLRLRERFPSAHIALLTPAKLRDLWPQHPALNEAISFAAGESPWRIGRRLRAARYDLGVVLANSPRSALECWLAGIPQRVGYARPWRSWLLTHAIPPRPGEVKMRKRSAVEVRHLTSDPSPACRREASPAAHHLHQYLHLTTALGASAEPVPPLLKVTREEVAQTRAKFGLGEEVRWLGINAGAEYGPAKRWPITRFAEVARTLADESRRGLAIFGGPSEAVLAAQLQSAIGDRRSPIRNLAGRTTLRELMAALSLCQVVLTNDTGPMHVAAALGVPIVAIFGSTSPALTGPGWPGDPRHRLLSADVACAPCFLRECPIDLRCLNGIAAAQVTAAVREVMERGSPA